MHQRDRSRPPGDPSLMRGGIDGYRIEMAKNEKTRGRQRQQKQKHTQPPSACKAECIERTHPWRGGCRGAQQFDNQ